ncbi:hypothetical protein QCA50_007908 [Cerrena zonata]|uniref:DUF6535 domain-containing protein n=1 Tax=Cerrena zonata TaxID=2478898 RepID=A0AAW0GH10_9APHY
MPSSSSRRRRKSRESSRSSASDVDGDVVRVPPSDSQKHNDRVPAINREGRQSKADSDYFSQDVENVQSPVPTPPSGLLKEGTAANTVLVDATPASDQQHRAARESPSTDKNTTPKTGDKIHRVKIESDRTGWGRISDLIHQYDRDRVEDVKEDIDTLLVFAGLFSAVITAFIIESYKMLQQQPEDTTNQILLQLSAQLASLALSGNFVNSTIPPFITPSFSPVRFSVLINTLWLLSLVFALVTASLGILIKQWLHELMARDTQDPRQQVKIRFFREVGVQRWQIFEIAAVLPLLLQLALLLFFIGLSAFLHDLNTLVTWVITGAMILWLVFYLFTTFSPIFSSQCPYKTPMLKGILKQVRVASYVGLSSLGRALYNHVPVTWPRIKQRCKGLRNSLNTWSAVWTAHKESEVCKNRLWDLPTLTCSQEILRGEQLEEAITDCVRGCGVNVLFECIHFFSRGGDPVLQGVLPDVPRGLSRKTCELFASRIGNLDSSLDRSNYVMLYARVTYASSKVYDPPTNYLFQPALLPMFSRLIDGDMMSATVSILIIYSVTHNTMESHPGHFGDFRGILNDDELEFEMLPDTVGAEFITNLVIAAGAICRNLWNQSHLHFRHGEVEYL